MEPIFASTTELAAAIREGELSAVAVLDAYLAQIARHNPHLNAIVTLDAEGASARARAADAALARGEVWGPLHGVPFTLKDSFETAGMRTTAGYAPLGDYVPTEDSTVAARLKAAGGILLGKTNVSVLLSDIQSDNPIFGRTLNPWNPARTSGGSSGGAAVALAAGMIPCEIGSDVGGSIRIPSHFCGVFGLKPTENRVSGAGHIPGLPDRPRSARIMNAIGPLARSVDDLALLFGIIAGPDGRDTEVPPVPVEAMPDLTLKDLRLAYAPTFPGFTVAAEVRAAVEALADQLRPLCKTVEAAPLPDLDYTRAPLSAPDTMAAQVFPPEGGRTAILLAQYFEALQRRDRFIVAWERFFDEWDAILCPVSMVPAFPHCPTDSPLAVDGQMVDYWMANAHVKIFNYTGQPAIVLPYTHSHDGLPIGVQLAGKRWGESRLLAIARAISEVTGPFQRPPGF